ncbi:MAG: hypothetical protein JNM76_03290 [Betaproteobacteria bacterium]|nr:hypothetical protein [Betaproteobacteria bacterium]
MNSLARLKVAALGIVSLSLCYSVVGSAQTLSINGGTPCSYTQYVKTVGTNGVPNFAFTAAGCSSGGSTPTAGTMQFTAASYGSMSTGGTTQVLVTNVGRVTGGGNALTGTVTSLTTGVCTVPPSSTVNFSDSDLNNKAVTVTAVTAGTCNLSLTGAGTGAPNQTTITVVDPTTPGTIAFTTASQSAVAGQASVTFTVAQTGAGASAPASSVAYNCISTGVPSGSYAPTFAPASSGTLNWAIGENASKTFSSTVPTLPGGATSATITCQITSPTGGASLGGQQTHQVTVSNQPAPVCTPSAIPATLTAGTGGTVTLNANCTNSPSSFTWAPVGGAPALSATNVASPTATFGTTVTAGTYSYSLTASNGTSSTPANATVTVNAPAAAGCVIRDKVTQYPDWVAGNAPNTASSPAISQNANDTIAFRMPLTELSNQGMFQLYESMIGVMHTLSITINPCDFTDTVTGRQCQVSNSSGSFSLRFVHNGHPASDSVLQANNYCRLPAPGAQSFLYVNVRFAAPPNIIAPPASTCTIGACTYFPLYARF